FIFVFLRWPVEWVRTPHTVVLVLQPLSLCVLVVFSLVEVSVPQWLSFLVHLLAFFLTALLCHGELARDRPSIRHLTEFYLCMSVGGALGGLLNGLVAPMVFDRYVEYMLVLALSCLPPPPGSVRAAPPRPAGHRRAESTTEDYYLDVGYAVCLGLLTYALVRIAVARNLWGEIESGEAKSFHYFVAEQLEGLGVAWRRAWGIAGWLSTGVVAG